VVNICFVGFRAADDTKLMKQNQIHAMVSVLSTTYCEFSVPKNMHLYIQLDDFPGARLDQHFSEAIRFIHKHRMENSKLFIGLAEKFLDEPFFVIKVKK
jgi:hypothetical protein